MSAHGLLASRLVQTSHHVAAQAIACPQCGVGPGVRCKATSGNTGHVVRVHEHRARTAPEPTTEDMSLVFGCGRTAVTLHHIVALVQDHGVSLVFVASRYGEDIYSMATDTRKPWGCVRFDVLNLAVARGLLVAVTQAKRQSLRPTPRLLALAAVAAAPSSHNADGEAVSC